MGFSNGITPPSSYGEDNGRCDCDLCGANHEDNQINLATYFDLNDDGKLIKEEAWLCPDCTDNAYCSICNKPCIHELEGICSDCVEAEAADYQKQLIKEEAA